MTDPRVEPLHHVYYGQTRKPCQVQLAEGTWLDAEIRSWDRDTTGQWSASLAWTYGPGQSSRLDRFDEERVRPMEEEV